MTAAVPVRPDRDLVRAHAALVAVQVLFGLFPIFGKLALLPGGFTPFGVGAWRMAFGAAALGGLAALVHGRALWAARTDFWKLLVASVLGVTANMLLYLVGLSHSSANEATLIMCLIPVFTFALAALAGQERLRAARAAGVVVALLGASALFWAQRPEIARLHLGGNLLMALNALSYSLYFVWTRPLLARHPPLVVIAWVFLLSTPAAVAIALTGDVLPSGQGWRPWASLAFILVFPTALAYLLNLFALARLRASTTAVYIYTQPLVTVLASALVLGEAPTRGVLVAAVLVFAGIWLVARRPPPARPLEPAAERAGGGA